ncbi:hypothetical protein Hsar01_02770 [Haloferula sargassicola]|uniref:Transposase n=1 Tax=Haloferula sargassicola TaxID=490096 RepID=A0ABP9UPQ2_9BACT
MKNVGGFNAFNHVPDQLFIVSVQVASQLSNRP